MEKEDNISTDLVKMKATREDRDERKWLILGKEN